MKNHKKILQGTFAILLTGLILAACSAGAPATPTTDPNVIFTQVAETVMVGITQTAAAMPTNTPAPTNTPVPTPIPLPTQDLSIYPTLAPVNVPGIPTTTPQRYGNWAKWYGQSPSDGQTFTPYEVITFHGCMRNIGDTVWNTSYYLMLVSGPKLWGSKYTWNVGTAVQPTQVWCWDMYPSTMPSSKGNYTTRFYFYSDKNVKLFGDGEVYFTYNVG
jgi:hypothetical protein